MKRPLHCSKMQRQISRYGTEEVAGGERSDSFALKYGFGQFAKPKASAPKPPPFLLSESDVAALAPKVIVKPRSLVH